MRQELTDIITASLEDVMHECFMPYAEYVILERALPRVEDGLKPVQRRILYAMHEMQLVPTSKHKKCARIVGETMGKYHPHGDTSIYDALARMAQDFSMSIPLIDGQGNFGSIDGDGPAAMRYTEARLAPFAQEILRDIEKDTVPFQLNFDDTLKEPLVLPSRYPNLLVNGTSGIAVGLATNIPPHNLGEVINGTVYRMQHPDCNVQEIMQYIKGPDFPTGGSIFNMKELETAYETGRGKITLRAKTHIEELKNGKTLIVITELPYEVRESAMLRKIQGLKETKKEMFASIDAIRSETDRTGIRAVIELKKGADTKKVLDCLYKYSDLQITYGINMVAIAEGQPKQLGILSILDYYISHQRTVVTRRVRYDIEQAEEKEHKLEGLMIAVDNIDLVIKLIRSSKNAREAKQKLMERLDITGVQAQTILDMRLARLTQLEIDELIAEHNKVVALLKELREILASKEKLDGVIITEMQGIQADYAGKRRTAISEKSAEVVIDEKEFKAVEDTIMILTRGGNLKRMSPKAYTIGSQNGEIAHHYKPKSIIEATTEERLYLFTNFGNLYTLPVDTIKEAKFKEAGSPLNALIAGVEKKEKILFMTTKIEGDLLTVSENGLLKYTDMQEFETKKKQMLACGLREGDRLVYIAKKDDAEKLLLITKDGFSILFSKDEISKQGRVGTGIGGIRMQEGDRAILAAQVEKEGSVVVFTDAGYVKKTKLSEYELQGRNGKGQKTILWNKNGLNGAKLQAAFYITQPSVFEIMTEKGEEIILSTADMPEEARYANGMQLIFPQKGDAIDSIERL